MAGVSDDAEGSSLKRPRDSQRERRRSVTLRRLLKDDSEDEDDRETLPSISIKKERTSCSRRVQGYDVNVPQEDGLPGHILRIKLVYFMCHEHFEIYFGGHVNFVSGKNGSGKSAILQALQVCLGSRASETGRGKSVHTFIKTGKAYAKVAVTLWNTGAEAYCYLPSEYGRVITVERVITAKSSRYTLINESGVCVSTKYRDLEALLSVFGIRCKNPMVVLSQVGRQSWRQKLPSDLYKLYMKATEFEEAAEDHAESHRQIENQKRHIEGVQKQLQEMQMDQNELAERLVRAKEERTAAECLEISEKVHGFLMAREKEEVLTAKQAELHEQIAAVTSLEAELESCQETAENAIREKETFDADGQAATIRTMLDRLRTEENELKQQRKTAEKACRDPKKQIALLQSDIQRLQSDKTEKARNLEKLKSDDGREIRAAQDEFAGQVGRAQSAKNLLEKESHLLEEKMKELNVDVGNKEKQLKELVDTCDEYAGDVRRLDGNLKSLQNTQRNPIAMFGGEPVQRLLTALQRARDRFDHEPIGPLGRYLAVRDEMWSVAMEFTVGRLFNAFIVHSLRDEETFRTLCKQLNLRTHIQVIVYPFDREPYSLGSYGNPPYQTILKMLQIAEFQYRHIIQNILIDYGSIERIVLSPSEDEAFQIIRRKTQGFVPLYVRLPTGRKVYMKRGSEATMHDGRKLQPRLVKDITQQIRRTMTELQRVKDLLERKKSEKKACEQDFRELTKVREEGETELRSVKMELLKQGRALDELKERGPTLPLYALVDTETLEQGIAMIGHEIQRKQQQIKDLEMELQYKEQQVKAIDERIASQKLELLSKKQHADELSVQLNQIISNCKSTSSKVEKIHAALSQSRAQLSSLADAVKCLEQEVKDLHGDLMEEWTDEDFAHSLLKLQEQLPELHQLSDELTSCTVQSWMVELKRRIRNFHLHCSDSYEDLQCQHEALSSKIDYQSSAIDQLEKICHESEVGHKKRGELYRQSQRKMDSIINSHFSKYMKKRRHHGTLKPNHRQQVVEIRVRIAGQDEKVSDMASLSGGERSFTTVSLLLSLAAVVKSPFHCMDEFDVFTDAVTKQSAIQALLETASTEKRDSQFIFFSPQEVDTVEDVRRQINVKNAAEGCDAQIPPKFVMIYHMAPPER